MNLRRERERTVREKERKSEERRAPGQSRTDYKGFCRPLPNRLASGALERMCGMRESNSQLKFGKLPFYH